VAAPPVHGRCLAILRIEHLAVMVFLRTRSRLPRSLPFVEDLEHPDGLAVRSAPRLQCTKTAGSFDRGRSQGTLDLPFLAAGPDIGTENGTW